MKSTDAKTLKFDELDALLEETSDYEVMLIQSRAY